MITIAQQLEVDHLINDNKNTMKNIDLVIAKANYNTECSLLLHSSISEEAGKVSSTLTNAISAAFKLIQKIISKVLDIVFKLVKLFKKSIARLRKVDWVDGSNPIYAEYKKISATNNNVVIIERVGKAESEYCIFIKTRFNKQIRPLDRQYSIATKAFISKVKNALANNGPSGITAFDYANDLTISSMTNAILEECFVFASYDEVVNTAYNQMVLSEALEIVQDCTLPSPKSLKDKINNMLLDAEISANDAELQITLCICWSSC